MQNDGSAAAIARHLVRDLSWGALVTTSTRSRGTNVSDPFGNPYSFADVAGVPYFYAADMDASMVDLFHGVGASPRASLALSEASVQLPNGSAADAACRIGDGAFGDPENPPCARLVLTGVVSKVAKGSAEEATANAALFSRHPSFKLMPKDHHFYTAKLDLDGIWLIAAYGGASIVDVADYFAVAAPLFEAPAPAPASATAPTVVETYAMHEKTTRAASSPPTSASRPFDGIIPATAKPTARSPPFFFHEAKLARWMVSTLTWGVLSTTSTRSQGTNVSDPFGNPYSFADVQGEVYLYGTTMDASMIDLFGKGSRPRATLALSEAALGGHKSLLWKQKCQIGKILGDPENPPCARLVLSGTVLKVEAGSHEEAAAKRALFGRHPSFAHYPPGHEFFVSRLAIDGLWLIDMFGGAAIIDVADYFAA